MSKERSREVFKELPGPDYWARKAKEGWKLVAAEWERIEEKPASAESWIEEVPYGMKVAEDGLHLVENPTEKEALILMLEMIVADKPLSEVAESVNRIGYGMRNGMKWTQVAIFNLLPRLVEVASRIYPTDEWSDRRDKIFRLAR